ncbi:hypothetical protein ON010_g11051 [Phytophthora cinnamomi]|nr:hypothetical protein ON010_g11051 [Phytophthora cinnamomi]
MSGNLARVSCVVRALVRGWESIQVELHGSYSVERFISLQKYRESTSLRRLLVVLGTIPLPPLACAAVVDALPLESPDLGLAHSGTVWVRGTLVALFGSYAMARMFGQYVPELDISRRTIISSTIAATVVVQVSALCLTMLLWYPLPFTLIWVANPWIWTLALSLKLSKGEFLRNHAEILNEVRRFSTMLILSTSTGLMYIAFNSIFQTVPAEWQTPTAVLVPVFKIIQKNVYSRLLRGKDDVKPEIVTLNVDVANALFISSTMQNLQSVKSSAMLITLDFAQMLTSLFDLSRMIKEIRETTNKEIDQAIASALLIAHKYPELQEEPMLPTRPFPSRSDIFKVQKIKATTDYIARFASITRVAPMPAESNIGAVPDYSFTSPTRPLNVPTGTDHTTVALVDQMTPQQRHLLLHKVLQIMFFVEFLLLSEFMKALMPAAHSE